MEGSKLISVPKEIWLALKKSLNSYEGSKKEQGFKAGEGILNTGTLTKGNAKMLKHRLESGGKESLIWRILNGDVFLPFLNRRLKDEGENLKRGNNAKKMAGKNNAHRKAHSKNTESRLNLFEEKKMMVIILKEKI